MKSKKIWVTVLLFLIVGGVITVVFSTGIYLLGWNNYLTQGFLRIIPLPAVLVDRKFISLAEFSDYEKAYERLVTFQTKYDFTSFAGQRELANQRQKILHTLIENRAVEVLFDKYDLVLANQELDRYYNYLLKKFGVPSLEADRKIASLFGISEAKFKKMIVKPDLRRIKLSFFLLENQVDSEDFRQARQVREELQRGIDFASASEIYSEDETNRYVGGSLGFVAYEELPPWIEDKVRNLSLGEISEVVTSADGYHIFSMIARSPGGKKVYLRDILIKAKPFENFLEDELENYRIYSFVQI